MDKYIKLEDAINISREKQIIVNGDAIGVRYSTPDEIIKDLSDLPTIEVSEDCISRANLRRSLARPLEINNADEMYWKGWHDCTVAVETRITDSPSVVPSRAEGEWNLELLEDGYYGARIVCSVCGHKHYDSLEKKYTKFCPDCGARMRR